jgi:hypothetical protein
MYCRDRDILDAWVENIMHFCSLQDKVREDRQAGRQPVQIDELIEQAQKLLRELQAAPAPVAHVVCPQADARAFVAGLGIEPEYFEPEFDRCFCASCYSPDWPDTISNQGPTPYEIPRGWVRFGLKVSPGRAASLKIFEEWSVSFHGVKSDAVLKSVLDAGGLLKPGDRLLDGTKLRSSKCAGRQDLVFYTSPTIRYAGLKFYAEPHAWRGDTMHASIALQCRQKPASFRTQGETMGFERSWPGHLARTCPHVDLDHIEWLSDTNAAAIPYGLLVRVWPTARDPDAEVYKSPVDQAPRPR